MSIPEESSAADGSGLLFVNPYATGEIGAKIDPLQDLKSFLNNVDPSKPLDPELKKLLEIIAENMENDDDVLKDLRTIKKSVKDKKVEELIEETIKKINQKKK